MVAKDAIKEIKRVEENGAQLIVNARTESKYLVESAEKDIKEMTEQETLRLELMLEKRLEEARLEGEKILSEKRESAKIEAEALAKGANSRIGSAVELIIKEITGAWQ